MNMIEQILEGRKQFILSHRENPKSVSIGGHLIPELAKLVFEKQLLWPPKPLNELADMMEAGEFRIYGMNLKCDLLNSSIVIA